jgi:hypothetical protein
MYLICVMPVHSDGGKKREVCRRGEEIFVLDGERGGSGSGRESGSQE